MLVFTLTLAGVLLFSVLRDLDWGVFLRAIKNIQASYLVAIALWSSAAYFIRAMRLRFLLNNGMSFKISSVFWASMTGYLGNSILPARAGELIRAAYLVKKSEAAFSFIFAVGIVERIVDLIVLVVLGAFAFPYTQAISFAFQNAMGLISLIGLLGLVAIFVLPYQFQLVKSAIAFVFRFCSSCIPRIEGFVKSFFDGLISVHRVDRFGKFIGITSVIWMMDAFGLWTLGYALNLSVTLAQTLVLLAALGLSSAIPSTPGYVGVYQFVAVTILGPFGVSRENALAYIFISQIINYVVVGTWGLVGLGQFNKKDNF